MPADSVLVQGREGQDPRGAFAGGIGRGYGVGSISFPELLRPPGVGAKRLVGGFETGPSLIEKSLLEIERSTLGMHVARDGDAAHPPKQDYLPVRRQGSQAVALTLQERRSVPYGAKRFGRTYRRSSTSPRDGQRLEVRPGSAPRAADTPGGRREVRAPS